MHDKSEIKEADVKASEQVRKEKQLMNVEFFVLHQQFNVTTTNYRGDTYPGFLNTHIHQHTKRQRWWTTLISEERERKSEQKAMRV